MALLMSPFLLIYPEALQRTPSTPLSPSLHLGALSLSPHLLIPSLSPSLLLSLIPPLNTSSPPRQKNTMIANPRQVPATSGKNAAPHFPPLPPVLRPHKPTGSCATCEHWQELAELLQPLLTLPALSGDSGWIPAKGFPGEFGPGPLGVLGQALREYLEPCGLRRMVSAGESTHSAAWTGAALTPGLVLRGTLNIVLFLFMCL